jgi:enoyl-CoA hydratase/carnithine racemase
MVGAAEDHHRLLFEVCTEMMLALHRIPQPVVAQVQGPATAAGCQLVASCDLAIAAESAWFATPGVKIGLFCSTPMVPLTRAVGRKRAMEMLLTGDRIDSATAVAWGLVNRAVPDDRLDAEVDELVDRILRSSRRVVGLGKEAFYRQVDEIEEDAYRSMAAVMTGNAGLADAQEGMSAFLEKRPPTWPE